MKNKSVEDNIESLMDENGALSFTKKKKEKKEKILILKSFQLTLNDRRDLKCTKTR